jgi:hypothetical protein
MMMTDSAKRCRKELAFATNVKRGVNGEVNDSVQRLRETPLGGGQRKGNGALQGPGTSLEEEVHLKGARARKPVRQRQGHQLQA